jgi:hypothetical protein
MGDLLAPPTSVFPWQYVLAHCWFVALKEGPSPVIFVKLNAPKTTAPDCTLVVLFLARRKWSRLTEPSPE